MSEMDNLMDTIVAGAMLDHGASPNKWTPARQEAQNIIWREYIAPKLGIKLEPWQLDLLKSQYR